MRARTVGDLRRELDGISDDVPVVVEVPAPWIYDDALTLNYDRIDGLELDIERVDTTLPSHVTLHADREDLP